MEFLKKFIKQAFRKKFSEYVYLTYINNTTGTEISSKYMCLEYFIGEPVEKIKDRIISLLKLEFSEIQKISHFTLRIQRYRNILEYSPEKTKPFEKYDIIILECE